MFGGAGFWAILAVILVVSGCGNMSTDPPALDRYLTISRSDDTAHFVPFSVNFSNLGQFTTGTLIRVTSRGQEMPGVAERIGPDRVRPEGLDHRAGPMGSRFSNGTPVTSDDVAASIRAYADPKMQSPIARALRFRRLPRRRRRRFAYRSRPLRQASAPAKTYLGLEVGIWPVRLVQKVLEAKDLESVRIDPLTEARGVRTLPRHSLSRQ